MSYEISNKVGSCFLCGKPTHIVITGTTDYFCKSKACTEKVLKIAEDLIK